MLAAAGVANGHEGPHQDPELLNHWRTQVHLAFQWAHLVAFGLWLGGMLAASRVRSGLAPLLFASWGLFLVSLGTGSYNMEFGAATPDAPDILSLPGLSGRWPFGDAYIVLIGAKQALFVLAALWAAAITIRHLRLPPNVDRRRLRNVFVAGNAGLGITLAAVTAAALVLHEAVDLAPTPLHSLGGVAERIGADERAAVREARRAAPAPYGGDTASLASGFALLAVPRVAGDALARFTHLLGFALWLGSSTVGSFASHADSRRLVPLVWLALALLVLSGGYQMASWTPFALTPFPWRLSSMADFRFGYTYTLVLAIKLGLAGLVLLGALAITVAARKALPGPAAGRALRILHLFNLLVGLALAYMAVTLLLVHEGVDHAL
jgi:hypothetical protein